MSKDEFKKQLEKIRSKSEVDEAYLVGLLWYEPVNNYGTYHSKIEQSDFINDVWGFFYALGREMYSKGVKEFDDITVHATVKELGMEDLFRAYGNKRTVDEAVALVSGGYENIEYYFERLEKNTSIRKLIKLFGSKILLKKDKYDYEKMTTNQLLVYWTDQLNKISLDTLANYETENLYIDADEFIEDIEEGSANMLPWSNSYHLNSITQGIPKGEVTMFGGFGGSGKSSILADKYVMSCIENQEKLIIVLNEEDAHAFRQKIVLSILQREFYKGEKRHVSRKKFSNGDLTEKDKENIRYAFRRFKELTEGDESQIKVVYMEKYTMDDLENIIRYWSNRGYDNLLVDTHKVTDDYSQDKRWEAFVEDTKKIHKMTRAEAGGLNLRTVISIQLSDASLNERFLGYTAIGEGKAAKNEASILIMFRPLFGDEYDDLDVYRNVMENGVFKGREKIHLEKEKSYYLFFVPKNRFGQNTDNGQPILVVEPNFEFNEFKEIGWTNIARTYM